MIPNLICNIMCLTCLYHCQKSKPYPLLNPTLCPARLSFHLVMLTQREQNSCARTVRPKRGRHTGQAARLQRADIASTRARSDECIWWRVRSCALTCVQADGSYASASVCIICLLDGVIVWFLDCFIACLVDWFIVSRRHYLGQVQAQHRKERPAGHAFLRIACDYYYHC